MAIMATNQTNHFLELKVALRRAGQSGRVCLMVLHADPFSVLAGGTERQVRSLATLLANQQATVLIIFPARYETIRVRCLSLNLDLTFHRDSLSDLMPLFEASVDVLHVHHTLGWNESNQTLLARSQIPYKILTLHDYYFICPSVNLLKAPAGLTFCGVERDLVACNHCLQQFHGYRLESIELYRQKKLALLQAFDQILLPSSSMEPFLAAAFGKGWQELTSRCSVLPHDLTHLTAIASPICKPVENKKRMVFIGSLSLLKGAQLIAAAIPILISLGYEIEIWGRLHGLSRKLKKLVKQRSFTEQHELQTLFTQFKPAIAVFASITAETFSFVFYETLLLGGGVVPVVSQFGHPAQIVTTTGMGLVMPNMTVAALVQSCIHAEQHYAKLLQAKQRWLNEWHATYTSYTSNYLALLTTNVNKPTRSFKEPDWEQIQSLDQQRLLKAKRRYWWQVIKRVRALINSKYNRPYYMKQLLSKAWHIFKSEGLNGIKDRMNRLS
jgi:hypothetical protein